MRRHKAVGYWNTYLSSFLIAVFLFEKRGIMATFDKHANEYDSWFLNNRNMLESEVKLLAHFMDNCGETLSVGCGSGLFESILKNDYNIEITNGIEPSAGMAEIARKRGVDVEIGTAEDADFGLGKWDTVLFNGTPSYIKDLKKSIEKAYDSLKEGGKIVMLDVPKESSYGLIYNLAKTLGTWEHPMLEGTQPPDPYPLEFVKEANWRTTSEKVELLEGAGFKELDFAQTLTNHPSHSNREIEEPTSGHSKGDYVAICAYIRS
jgi:SAM-dependent methyltransferase